MRHLARTLTLLLLVTSCGVLGGGDGVHESTGAPVELDLAAPSYAVATRKGLTLRSGEAKVVLPKAYSVEWLPGGLALVYLPGQVRIWDPATDTLGDPVTLGTRDAPIIEGDLKRSVFQIDVTLGPDLDHPDTTRLAAYSLDLEKRWLIDLPGPDDTDPDAGSGDGLVRSYRQGHTIDGITYLMWSDFDPNGEETEEHYGLLRVDHEGTVIDQVQVNQRSTSMWLGADGASLLALRRVSGHPCGGCQVTLELVELDPATGDVVAEYGMPEEYAKTWDVSEVDKVGDRVAIRFTETEFPESEAAENAFSQRLVQRGTWVRDGDGWSMVEGSEREVSWWQGPDDRIVARPIMKGSRPGHDFRLFWVHGNEQRPIRGTMQQQVGRRIYSGSVPGQALPPD